LHLIFHYSLSIKKRYIIILHNELPRYTDQNHYVDSPDNLADVITHAIEIFFGSTDLSRKTGKTPCSRAIKSGCDYRIKHRWHKSPSIKIRQKHMFLVSIKNLDSADTMPCNANREHQRPVLTALAGGNLGGFCVCGAIVLTLAMEAGRMANNLAVKSVKRLPCSSARTSKIA